MRTHSAAEVAKAGDGAKVIVGGWVDSVREHGNIKFLILRDMSGTCQVTAKKGDVPDALLEDIRSLVKESVVLVHGTARKSEKALRGIEVIPEKLEILSVSEKILPLDPNVESNMDTRLQWRYLDFRNPKVKAIFSVQNTILHSFRSFFEKRGFMEMQPPIIIASASEGGADLFPLSYFERKAYLAQSPQLYKQMGAMSFEKVFMISPVFRAEKFDTPTHLNEIRQMDAEFAFADDEDAMKLLEECFIAILKEAKGKNEEELKLLGVNPEIPKTPIRHITYTEAIETLQKAGEIIKIGDDFTKLQEALLAKKIKSNAFFIKDWVPELKAFYAMPKIQSDDSPRRIMRSDAQTCKAFDLIYNGIEVSSGTQRIHDPLLLEKRIAEKGLNPKNFEYYINCFRFGAPPHAGWSIGLERMTMALLGMKNIRECCMFPRDRTRLEP